MSINNFPIRGVEVIGHRGNVSSYPENTIQGFESLIELEADALELDLVISADKKVVVSHEAYMSADYMLTPEGHRLTKSEEKNHQLYQMPYDNIKSFKIGSRRDHKFPKQKKITAYKPLLTEVFSAVEEKLKVKTRFFNYYLEIKSVPAEYGFSQPHPHEFVELVMQVVQRRNLEERIIIKSFDPSILSEVHKTYPEIKISFLIYKTSIEESLKQLNFPPQIISPYYSQLKKREKVLNLQEQGFKIIPWTVNPPQQIKKMLDFGVDGIISDYPEEVLKEKKRRSN